MQLTSFTPNRQFRLFQKVVTITSLLDPDSVVIVNNEGQERVWDVSTLLVHYASGNLKAIKTTEKAMGQPRVTLGLRLVDDVSEEAKRQGFARQRYLAAVEAVGVPLKEGNKRLQSVLEGVRRELGLAQLPSVSSLKRWRRRFRAQGGDPVAHIPYLALRGGPGKQRMSPEVQRTVHAVLDNFYLTSERYTVTTAYKVLRGQLLEKNKWLPSALVHRIPSFATFRRCLLRRSGYEVTAAREGAAHALKLYRPSGKNIELYGLNECWETDHTELDVVVVDDVTGAVLGRPRFTVILEHFSRSVMGFDLGFSGASAQAVLDCLRQAILPKDWLQARYPNVKGVWPCHGVPMVLKCDNGPEFHSHSLKQACLELSIDLQYCPIKQPWYKARVERFFRTFNEAALKGLPGATGAHFWKRPEGADPAADAVITLGEMRAILLHWIVDDYMVKDHRGLS